jgi:hypothetical protein
MTFVEWACFLAVALVLANVNARAAERITLLQQTVYYVRSDGNNNNSGLADSRDHARADPQYALSYVENNLDFGPFNVTIHIDASTDHGGRWQAPPGGFVCQGMHLGTGKLILEGDLGGITVIDGTAKGTHAIVALNGCEIVVSDLTLMSGAFGNSLNSIGLSHVFFRNIHWGASGNSHAFVSRGAIVDQVGDDLIEGSANHHIVVSHGGHFRAVGTTTRFAADTNFEFFVFAHSFGEITYTGDPSHNPKFDLNGKTVTGIRCYADGGWIQAAGFGPEFFSGSQPCMMAHSGSVVD